MKTYYYILTFLFLPFAELYSQWHWQNPLPQGNSLYSVQYVTENIVWASGTTGTLLKSTDGGDNWEFKMVQERIYVRDVFFIDEENGWICGESEDLGSSYIFGTNDGGLVWENQYSQKQGGPFRSIVFANRNMGWAAGSFTNILHTTDSGQNWYIQSNAPANVSSIYLLDSLHLWATTTFTYTPTLKTSDGGINWIPDSTTMWAFDIHFLDTLVGWAAGWSSIAKTTDGGLNWEEQYYLLQEDWIDIFMLDENNGWVVSTSGLILATTNGGEAWIEQNNPAISGLSNITFKDSLNGISVGYFASLLKTTDGGNNWENKTQSVSEASLFSLYFINENTGWVSGEDGSILKTSDQGNNWIIQNSGVNERLNELCFIDTMMGWSVGDEGRILQTTNGGENWAIGISPTTLPLIDIDFTNYPIGWIVGGDILNPGKLFKTTNSGISWNTVPSLSLPPAIIFDLKFTSMNVGWIMCGNSSISGLQQLYRTTDGGDNWNTILSNNSDTTFLAMFFLNDSTGWISTFPVQKIFHTTNKGVNWERFEAPAIFNSIYFSGLLKGWGGTSTGEIYLTTDGGRIWVAQNSPMDNPIKKLFFHGENYGWAVGFLGNIIHTSNGGASFVDSTNTSIYPDDFLLFQNYPNPFNSLTRIRFEIPTSSVVNLKVYDILGRELITLVDEYKSLGKYEVDFDASEYSSGIYFYQLKVKDFVGTKKMILLK